MISNRIMFHFLIIGYFQHEGVTTLLSTRGPQSIHISLNNNLSANGYCSKQRPLCFSASYFIVLHPIYVFSSQQYSSLKTPEFHLSCLCCRPCFWLNLTLVNHCSGVIRPWTSASGMRMISWLDFEKCLIQASRQFPRMEVGGLK